MKIIVNSLVVKKNCNAEMQQPRETCQTTCRGPMTLQKTNKTPLCITLKIKNLSGSLFRPPKKG